jgi:Family of unknown function (DUF6502)
VVSRYLQLAQSDDRFERIQALSRALDPLIDYCLEHGVHSAELESMVRVEFVKRAEMVLPGNTRTSGKPSHEAIGLAAGLNRGEVQNILSSGKAGASLRMKKKWEKHTTSEKLLTIWEKNSRFVSNAGSPLDLPLEPQEEGPSFTELVQHTLPGKLPRHVLKELRRRGLVEQLADEIIRYRPRTATALSSGVATDALKYAAEQVSLLGQTLLQTIARGEPRKDFRTYIASKTVELPAEDLQVKRAAVLQRMGSFAQMFEREYGRPTKKTKAKQKIPTVKVGICVFTWQSK